MEESDSVFENIWIWVEGALHWLLNSFSLVRFTLKITCVLKICKIS